MNADLEMDELKREFERTNNPVFVWYAIMNMNWSDTLMPEWIDTYLHSVATNMVRLFYTASNDREADLVGKALGFGGEKKGDKSKFAEARKFDRDLMLYNRVVCELENESGTNLSSACAYVFRHGPGQPRNCAASLSAFQELESKKQRDE